MPVQGLSLEAHLIVDNNVLSMLSQYFCDRLASKCPAGERFATFKEWMGRQLDVIRQFTPDAKLHSTTCVANEFAPAGAFFAQLKPHELEGVKGHVRSLLHQTAANSTRIAAIRGLPGVPKKLFGPGGVSDNDLSLAVRGLELATAGQPVYILTNDQGLLDSVTWLRTNTSIRAQYPQAGLTQGLHSLTYFEGVHRNCKIQTPHMRDLLHYALAQHYGRLELRGTQKGESIMYQLLQINENLMQSIEIKLAAKGATP